MKADHDERDIAIYIRRNPLMVLGTTGTEGRPHGAVVFVYAPSAHTAYFATKNDTTKYRNLLHSPHVSLTGLNATENTTLQASGTAKTISDPRVIDDVMREMTKIHAAHPDWLPPTATLRAGPYQIVSVHIRHARIGHFHSGTSAKHIFEEY